SLVPAISEAVAKKQHQTVVLRSSQAIKLTIFIGIPSLMILYSFAEPLSDVFKSKETYTLLQVLALGGIFAYLQQTTTGILQGLGKVQLPVINTIISALIRIPLLFLLTGLPHWGLKGTAIAYVVGFIISASLNLGAIIHFTGMPINLREFLILPLIGGMGMLLVFRLFQPLLKIHPLLFLIVIGVGSICYILILLFNGGIDKNDLRRLPWIGKFF
ncbi:MAG: oligosaccharide flippase family protein, partial [Desulfitobacterium sp.]|nr:oligosaccharide flippase family protein [Desulfitobacterium sp.]